MALISYRVDMSSSRASERQRVIDEVKRIAYTGPNTTLDMSQIEFTLEEEMQLDKWVHIPSSCRVQELSSRTK